MVAVYERKATKKCRKVEQLKNAHEFELNEVKKKVANSPDPADFAQAPVLETRASGVFQKILLKSADFDGFSYFWFRNRLEHCQVHNELHTTLTHKIL